MKYYPHHIGDFDRATRHLTRIERSVYRDLIEVYYDTEQQLTLDMAALCRKIIARSNEEVTAVEQVLNEFFDRTDVGWYHPRCEEVLDEYRSSTSQKSAAGRASAAKRAEKRQQALNGNPTVVERASNGTPTNQEPITNNQESSCGARKRPTRKAPENFEVTEDMRIWASTNAPLVDLRSETLKFMDHTFAATRSDWPGTWRNWMRKAQEDSQQRNGGRGNSAAPEAREWHETQSGVEAKAIELSLSPRAVDEQFPAFKARVMKAAKEKGQ